MVWEGYDKNLKKFGASLHVGSLETQHLLISYVEMLGLWMSDVQTYSKFFQIFTIAFPYHIKAGGEVSWIFEFIWVFYN